MRYLLDSMYGLRAVHAAGLIHGDFKTLNMLVGPDQRVKVGDFGLSKCLGALSVLPGTKTITGTPQYMAPEVNLPVDGWMFMHKRILRAQCTGK
jgi:serine/threonine protein kinase